MDDNQSAAGCSFPATHWTLVKTAQGDDPQARRALNELCALCWPPVYAFVRRKGVAPTDAEDITQGVFAALLARESFASVAADKGRLRTFLLKAVTRYMINAHEKAGAAKRGGGTPLLSLDLQRVEGYYLSEPSHLITPELEFERQWALQVLDTALAEMRDEARQQGRGALFEDLKGLISMDATMAAYDTIATRHGISEGAVKAAAHRLRMGFRAALRRVIGATVCSEQEIDDEIQHLFTIFQRPQAPC